MTKAKKDDLSPINIVLNSEGMCSVCLKMKPGTPPSDFSPCEKCKKVLECVMRFDAQIEEKA